ncbi:DUF6193 family natural product biosynthesis protein [Streptomyces sp. S6]
MLFCARRRRRALFPVSAGNACGSPATALRMNPMAEAPDVETAWRWLLERKPGVRGATDDDLAPVARAAHAEPRLRALYPFPSHGALHFIRGVETLTDPPGSPSRFPRILYGGPPFTVYCPGFVGPVGELETAEEAAALAVRYLPEEVGGVAGEA